MSQANFTSSFSLAAFSDGVSGLFICNLLVALPANVLVLRVMAGIGMASDLFGLNLAASELVFCAASFYMLLHFSLRMRLDVGFELLRFFLQLAFMSRPVFQSCTCLERYLAVVHPTVYLRLKPLRYRLLCCCFDWLLVLLSCLTSMLVRSSMESAYLLIFKSLLFLTLMSYCGVHVLCVLKRPPPSDRGGESCSMKKKAFKVIAVTLVFTCTTQLLQLCLLGPALLYGSLELVLQLTLANLAINTICGFVTPLMYLHRAGKLPCIPN